MDKGARQLRVLRYRDRSGKGRSIAIVPPAPIVARLSRDDMEPAQGHHGAQRAPREVPRRVTWTAQRQMRARMRGERGKMAQESHVQDPPVQETALSSRVRALLKEVESPELAADLSAHTAVYAQVDAEIRGALHAGALHAGALKGAG